MSNGNRSMTVAELERTRRAWARLRWDLEQLLAGNGDARVPTEYLEPDGKQRKASQDWSHALRNVGREFAREAWGVASNERYRFLEVIALVVVAGGVLWAVKLWG